jgi:hypothetical protein
MAEEPRRCPFLVSAAAQRYRVLPEDRGEGRPLFPGAASFAEALLAAHGPGGALPLPRTTDIAAASAAGCPYAAAMRAQAAAAAGLALPPAAAAHAALPPLPSLARRLARAPLATMSFSRPGGPLTPVRARRRGSRGRAVR